MSNTTTTTHHTATHSHSMRFETVGLEVLSAVIHLFGEHTPLLVCATICAKTFWC